MRSEPEILDRAGKANRILNDALYAEAWQTVRDEILRKWETSPVRDNDGREYLYLMLKALNDARGYLEQAARDGKVVVHLQDQREKEKKRLTDLFKFTKQGRA